MSKAKAQRKSRILLVDDDENALLLVERYLQGLECEIFMAKDGQHAQEIMMEMTFDMAILDVKMPRVDGITLCRWIKSDPRYADCSVIFATAVDDKNMLDDAFDAGAMDFLSKPIDRHELIVRTKAALKMKASIDEVHRSHAEMQGALFKLKVKHTETRRTLTELREAQRTVLFSLAKLAESRDNETGRHLLRVQKYVELIAKSLQKKRKYRQEINKDYIESIILSSPLHDIGKVGIPDSILLKPGKLSKSEFEVMKEHSVIGANTLREAAQNLANPGFLAHAIEISRHHHEKHDGSGYPDRLKGEDIPLSARIMSLADNYDALRSRRVYKEPFPHKKSVRIIMKEFGEEYFHPDILDAFKSQEKEFETIATELADEE